MNLYPKQQRAFDLAGRLSVFCPLDRFAFSGDSDSSFTITHPCLHSAADSLW